MSTGQGDLVLLRLEGEAFFLDPFDICRHHLGTEKQGAWPFLGLHQLMMHGNRACFPGMENIPPRQPFRIKQRVQDLKVSGQMKFKVCVHEPHLKYCSVKDIMSLVLLHWNGIDDIDIDIYILMIIITTITIIIQYFISSTVSLSATRDEKEVKTHCWNMFTPPTQTLHACYPHKFCPWTQFIPHSIPPFAHPTHSSSVWVYSLGTLQHFGRIQPHPAKRLSPSSAWNPRPAGVKSNVSVVNGKHIVKIADTWTKMNKKLGY